MPTVTSAGGHLAAPLWQGGVEAGELRLPLQVVAHVAMKAGDASRQQVQHRHLTEMWPLRQRAAQSEDCAQDPRRKWTSADCSSVQKSKRQILQHKTSVAITLTNVLWVHNSAFYWCNYIGLPLIIVANMTYAAITPEAI